MIGIGFGSGSVATSVKSRLGPIRTGSRNEAEISLLKDEVLSPAAESSPVSPQKLDNLAQIEIACCTSIPAEYGEEIRFEQR